MKMKQGSRILILSMIASLVSNYTFANSPTKTTEPPYPIYTPAKGMLAKDQIPMEALWLHANANRYGDVTLPKSFDSNAYWQYLVNHNSDYQSFINLYDTHNCVVPVDDKNKATIERAMQQQGLDIYDGAVWQIALAIAAKDNPAYLLDVEGFKNFLARGIQGPGSFQSYYAFNGYTYNGVSMPLAKNSYLLKFVSPSWASNYDGVNDCNMQWPEWSAVTGEEAWAVFIGPVQSIYLLNDGANNPKWSSDAQAGDYIQLGINALGAIQQMQAPNGGVYRNVAPPGQPQNFDISLENNFSLYAGLTMFEQALKAQVATQSAKLKTLNKTANSAAVSKLQQSIASDVDYITRTNIIRQGLVKFFAGQGGISVFDRAGNYFYSSVNGTAVSKDFAVDVQTWGATVIATSPKKDPQYPDEPDLLQTMTDTYGADLMYNILESAISQSGYYDNTNKLLGVGYTAQKKEDPFYELSGEWTLGAINAAIVLADHYKQDADKRATLIKQAGEMIVGVTNEASNLQGSQTGGTSRLSYLYANKRAFIPFGWFSNKSPATASTGWSLMVNSCFNPLELGGGDYKAVCQELKLGK